MFAVIFEVQPKKERFDDYLNLAKLLKPELEQIDGFIDNERFGSKRTEGRVLSLSTWRDEKALIRWRTLGIHHDVQEKGRFEVFEDYHLRVGEIAANSERPDGQALEPQRLDETEISEAKVITITEFSPVVEKPVFTNLVAALGLPQTGTQGVVDQEVFENIYNPGELLLLVSWSAAVTADRWKPNATVSGELRHRQVRIIRDYGMKDRREAPQYYPPVPADGRG
jgi:heme-degrading monooxygenase HmoA